MQNIYSSIEHELPSELYIDYLLSITRYCKLNLWVTLASQQCLRQDQEPRGNKYVVFTCDTFVLEFIPVWYGCQLCDVLIYVCSAPLSFREIQAYLGGPG